jgi:glutamine synthetase
MKTVHRKHINPAHGSRSVERFFSAHPAITALDLLIPDTHGILRGKRIPRAQLAKVFADGVCLPGSLFGMDITGATVEASGLGFVEGDADRLCRPIPDTLAPVPWEANRAQLLMTMFEADGAPFFADPRQVLAGMLTRFKSLGLTPVTAVELEFYLLDPRSARNGIPQPAIAEDTHNRAHTTQVYGMAELDDFAGFLDAVLAACTAQRIPASGCVSEYAPGQYEINLEHQPDALTACDHAILLKRVVKAVARKRGLLASFMAKPFMDLAGSGTHIHLSLLDQQGRNVFSRDRIERNTALGHSIAGVLATLPESFALLAPNANSYRRFRPDSFVPQSACWGVNNRTVAVRVPAGPQAARRIEHRVAGADANPYLVMAALLAGVHHGLTGRLTPPPPARGNAAEEPGRALPGTWQSALDRYARGRVLGGYLGTGFRRAYLACQQAEHTRFMAEITPLEYAWYLRTL